MRKKMFALRKEWDFDDYLEGTPWSLYPWAAKLLRSFFIQPKWEINNMQGHAMHIKVQMQ